MESGRFPSRPAAVDSDGLRLSMDDAIALAFGASRPRTTSSDGLSVREQEVAALVARGLSNKEIATHLHLSVRTVLAML